ncbi:MAG: hypothetical protein H6815_13255 [Phycisphaeraceae bacterium]|nr:hypothetical protein [Phycisphaeraceae bacterium]
MPVSTPVSFALARRAIMPTLFTALCCGTVQPVFAQETQQSMQPVRRVDDGEPTVLAFKEVPVSDLLPFIVEATGKVVVLPTTNMLKSTKVTVLSDQEITRSRALDLVFLTLNQAGVAVVETEDTIILRDINEIDRQDVPVIPASESVLNRTDHGVTAQKVYTLYNSTAKELGDVLKDNIPTYAKMAVDEESNQIAIMGNIALLQRMERLITSLDQSKAGALRTQTFPLRYADAEQISQNIEDLYSGEGSGGNSNNNNNRRPPWMGGNDEESSSQASENLRVTANTQQNSVTVVAEPGILSQVRELIQEHWDLPLKENAVLPKVYNLKNSDAVKVRDLLENLFGESSVASGGSTGGNNNNRGNGGFGNRGGNQNNTAPQAGLGAGRLAGQFSFEVIPDSNQLVVVAKTPDNLAYIDKIIEDLDKPQTSGLPVIIELKHASAEELAEQLNALLALEGTLAQIVRQETGLSEGEGSGVSPFATTTINQNGQNNNDPVTGDIMQFWWQRSQPPTDESPSSNLVGRIRIVPVWRQNAVMVLSPPEYRASMSELIASLDRPGRQVLIKAIICEVATEDATALGLRWSSSPLSPSFPDTAIGLGLGATGSATNIASSLFNTSTLDASVDVNFLLQALAQKTAVNVLSEPRIFTSDNQEAEFFDGQDIPFVTDSQVTNQGNQVQSFDYRAVGIQLRARPRITVKGEVDLRVNVELSSIVQGETLFGGFIVDRRETTTQLVVNNGQTVVISGIFRSEDVDIVRKLPFIGDLPLIGSLFRSTEKTTANTELMVFITPVVIGSTEDLDSANANEHAWLAEQQKHHAGSEFRRIDQINSMNSSWDQSRETPSEPESDTGANIIYEPDPEPEQN